jgi:high-affinity iron transporter
VLITSVVLVLREVLEAAILIAILVAVSRSLGLSLRWILAACCLAVPGIFIYVSALETLTDSLEGAGQEVFNAALHLSVYLAALGVVTLAGARFRSLSPRWLALLMMLTVALAAIREGSEILVYLQGFAGDEAYRQAVFAGSAIGAGIGASIGVLTFAVLRAPGSTASVGICRVLLWLIGCGMVMQASMLLEQVDWLPAAEPLWSTADWIAEQSVLGEMLYAVFGYEATPSVVQVLIYAVCLALMILLSTWSAREEARYG